jgi:hypothetical protein
VFYLIKSRQNINLDKGGKEGRKERKKEEGREGRRERKKEGRRKEGKKGEREEVINFFSVFFSFFFFVVLGLELRAYTLSHSTSPFFFFCDGFL